MKWCEYSAYLYYVKALIHSLINPICLNKSKVFLWKYGLNLLPIAGINLWSKYQTRSDEN